MKIKLYDCLINKLSKILPDYCVLCTTTSANGHGLCSECESRLRPSTDRCVRCAGEAVAGYECGRCQSHPPAFDRTVAAFNYREPATTLIHRLKFNGDLAMARTMGHLLAHHVSRHLDASVQQRPQLLIPVPLHRGKMMRRGFNQSIEFGRVIARQLDIPLSPDLVIRSRRTRTQRTLPLKERRANVVGSFKLTRPPQCQHVALIDDVMTSGATLEALAQTFKSQGVERIDCWVFARA